MTLHICNAQINWVYAIYYITFCNFFLIFIAKIININVIQIFCQLTFVKFIKISYIIVKILSSIFNIHLFYFSHLYVHSMELHSPNLCFFVSTNFNARNIIFNKRPIVLNRINSNSNKNWKILLSIQYTLYKSYIYNYFHFNFLELF